MTVIIGLVSILIDDLYGPLSPQQTSAMLNVYFQTRFIAKLSKNATHLINLQTQQTKPAPSPLNLVEIVEKPLSHLSKLATHQNVTISFTPPDTSPNITADPTHTPNIIAELIEIGIASSQDKTICITMSHNTLSITDPGLLLDADDLAQLTDLDGRTLSKGQARLSGISFEFYRQILHPNTLAIDTNESGTKFNITFQSNTL